MDKLLKRGLRQLRLKFRLRPSKEFEPVDKVAIRKKVQSLHEFDAEDMDEFSAISKFNMEAFQSDIPKSEKIVSEVKNYEIVSIITFINESCVSNNLKFYLPQTEDPEQIPQLLLSLPSSPARRALLQAILTAFKPLFPDRRIVVDGDSEKKSDWIVIDLKSVFVHIFDPQTRLEIGLDAKFENEYKTPPDESLSNFMNNLSNSLPRNIASRPNFIEKYLKNKQ